MTPTIFKEPSKVLSVIRAMDDSEQPRARNRARINTLFNGSPPWTDQEATEIRANTNVNFLEGPNVAHNARRQFTNAFLKPGNFFTVRGNVGPRAKRTEHSHTVTRHINATLKKSLPYIQTLRSTFAQVVLHGVGPVIWCDRKQWKPESIGIDDLRVPSGTRVDLSNLEHFAVSRRYTAGQLYRMTHGSKVDPGWDKSLVDALLTRLADKNTSVSNLDSFTFPEKIAEEYRSNGGYYDSDAVPTVNAWDFYFRSPEDTENYWRRRMVLETGEGATVKDFDFKERWLFNPDERNYADDIGQILHFQFADGANVAPFRIHSVRSLGYLLYAVCHLQNRLRCKFTDAVFEHMLWYFRNVSADDREKLENVQLHHMGLIPEGLSFVPSNERHTVDPNMAVALLAQHRQLMSENSASFVQDVNDGTAKELTATEVMTRQNSSNALINAMLTDAYTYQTFQYREICRRFCLKANPDPDVKKFRECCTRDGVPDEFFDFEYWDVECERTLGSGNKILEIAQSDKLMSWRNLYDPDAQREILHIATEANTDDPNLAERLVPMNKTQVSDAVHEASLAMGTLMIGLPVAMKRGINHIDYVETMLGMIKMLIDPIEANSGKPPEEQTVLGLANVITHTQQHIQIIAQDDNEKPRVKEYMNALGDMANLVRAYGQRLQESTADQGGLSAEAQAKLEEIRILSEAKAKVIQATAQLKLQHKDTAFQSEQRRKDAKTASEIATKDLTTQADVIRDNARDKQTPKPASKP